MTERLERAAIAPVAPAPSGRSGGDFTLPYLLAVLLRDRRILGAFMAVGLVVVLALALTRPTNYTSTFSFLPQAGQDQTRSGLASLAGQLGVAIGPLGGQTQPPQFYADLLKTREILGDVVHAPLASRPGGNASLSQFLNIHGDDPAVVEERTIRVLQEQVIAASVAARTTGMVNVTVRTRSAAVSREIAQRLLDGLNRFNVATRKSQASEERKFAENRLAEARTSLRVAEDALQQFLQGNRQYENSPQLTFQRERLQREVSLQEQVVTGLAQQYEDARLREVRETPVITVIERPSLAVLPDPRGRITLVVLGLVLFTVAGAAYVLAREGWRRQRRIDEGEQSYLMLADEWQRLRARFRRS
jgi:uncharacterized protein involved in exopolysaccharide biosynthesis